MIVCGGKGANPYLTTWSFFRASFSCTTLMALAPISTPTRFLPSPSISLQSVAVRACARQKVGDSFGRFFSDVHRSALIYLRVGDRGFARLSKYRRDRSQLSLGSSSAGR